MVRSNVSDLFMHRELTTRQSGRRTCLQLPSKSSLTPAFTSKSTSWSRPNGTSHFRGTSTAEQRADDRRDFRVFATARTVRRRAPSKPIRIPHGSVPGSFARRIRVCFEQSRRVPAFGRRSGPGALQVLYSQRAESGAHPAARPVRLSHRLPLHRTSRRRLIWRTVGMVTGAGASSRSPGGEAVDPLR